MNAALVPILQAKLHETNSKAIVTSSGINGLLVFSKSHKHNVRERRRGGEVIINLMIIIIFVFLNEYPTLSL